MSWLASVRKIHPGASLLRIAWWKFLEIILGIWFAIFYRLKIRGLKNIPLEGPLLFLSNHQSFLDPVIIGIATANYRQFHPLARSTLWKNWFFGKLISSINAMPVERGAADIAALRRCIEMLKGGQAVLIFPEGTRTLDGCTGPFETGLMLIIKRAKPVVVPVAIEGAFAAWPKDKKLSLTGRIAVEFGAPIQPDTLITQGSEIALNQLQQQIESMRLGLADMMKK